MSAKQWIETELLPGERILWSRSSGQLVSRRACSQFFGVLIWSLSCVCVFVAFAGRVSDVLAPSVTPYVFCLLVLVLGWRSMRYVYRVVSDSLWSFDALTNYRMIRAERHEGEYCLWSLPLVAITPELEQGYAVLHLASPYTYMWKDKMVVASGKDATRFLALFQEARVASVELPKPEPLGQTHSLLPEGELLYGTGEQLSWPREELGWRRWLLFWAIWSGTVLFTAWQNPPTDCTWVPWCVCGLVFVLSLGLLMVIHHQYCQYKEEWLPIVVGAENVYGKEFSPLSLSQCYPLMKVLSPDGTASFFFTEPHDYRDSCDRLSWVRNHTDIGRLLYMLGLATASQQTLDTQPNEQ